MYFKFCEDLNRKKENIPYILINYENDSIKGKEIKCYNLNEFINGAFNDISLTLNKILDFSNGFLDYEIISADIWMKYQIEKQIKIPRIGKEFKISIGGSGKFKEQNYVTIEYVDDIKIKKHTFKEEDLFPKKPNSNLFETSESKYSSYQLRVFKDAICDSWEEIIYVFLECLFSSKINHHIKKCEYCGDFFIAKRTDTKFCSKKHLINNEYSTCSQIVATLQKSYEYKQLMNIDKSNLASIINNKKYKNIDIDNYKKERDYFKKNYFKTENIVKLDNFIKTFLSNNSGN